MTDDNAPLCGQHDAEVRMRLATLHSDSSRPGLVALYECPECGHQRRMPAGTAA